MHWEARHAYKMSIGKPQGKKLHERPSYKWEDDTEIGLKKIWCDGVNRIQLA
jgi:hypothetical protein